jgi:hypothetical protein
MIAFDDLLGQFITDTRDFPIVLTTRALIALVFAPLLRRTLQRPTEA